MSPPPPPPPLRPRFVCRRGAPPEVDRSPNTADGAHQYSRESAPRGLPRWRPAGPHDGTGRLAPRRDHDDAGSGRPGLADGRRVRQGGDGLVHRSRQDPRARQAGRRGHRRDRACRRRRPRRARGGGHRGAPLGQDDHAHPGQVCTEDPPVKAGRRGAARRLLRYSRRGRAAKRGRALGLPDHAEGEKECVRRARQPAGWLGGRGGERICDALQQREGRAVRGEVVPLHQGARCDGGALGEWRDGELSGG